MGTLDDLKNRRSIRSYKEEQIRDSELDAVLEAGAYAPSGMGQQSAVMVAVQNKDVIAALERLNAAVIGDPNAHPFYGAPTVVNVLVDNTKCTPVENGSLVIGNMLNAAHAAGLGSIYIYRAREVFESPEGQELLKTWGLNGNYIGVGHVLLGYAAGDPPQAAPRKERYSIKIC
ncbi:MAG: nitroreductase family protein [Treponema sp.]|jgi:nitroreductase|nr:nitroreductase family protein [Treponema sp.]